MMLRRGRADEAAPVDGGQDGDARGVITGSVDVRRCPAGSRVMPRCPTGRRPQPPACAGGERHEQQADNRLKKVMRSSAGAPRRASRRGGREAHDRHHERKTRRPRTPQPSRSRNRRPMDRLSHCASTRPALMTMRAMRTVCFSRQATQSPSFSRRGLPRRCPCPSRRWRDLLLGQVGYGGTAGSY